MVICAEELSGIKEAIQAAFKEIEYQQGGVMLLIQNDQPRSYGQKKT